MSNPFPDAPKGSPGEIRAAGRSLHEAAAALESTESRLRAATDALSGTWTGLAAQSYRASADALGYCAHGAAEGFQVCARAVYGYATALEDAQAAIHRLRAQYDDANRRAEAVTTAAGHLAGALVHASKPAKAGIQTQLGVAQRSAGDAITEANSYVAAAEAVLTDFKSKETGYESQLGGDPFGALSPFLPEGPSFGVPAGPNGLSPYNGVIPVVLSTQSRNGAGPMFAAALPTGGRFPYNSGQKGGQPIKLPGNQGYKDKYGNKWQWDPQKGEWDVQHPDGSESHTNVGPDGEITHGPNNFPKQPKAPSGGDGGGGGPSTSEVIGAVGGGVVVAGAILLAPETGGGSLLALVGL